MRSLITGISGQDGAYLAELLLSKGYEVHGVVRRSATPRLDNIEHIANRLHLHTGDICDTASVNRIVKDVRPAELYHLAAMSFVRSSFDDPEYTFDADAKGTLRILEAVRQFVPTCRTYVAGSSEQFGKALPPQNEQTKFDPQSPYGAAKCFSHDITRVYRRAYGLHATVGILFNHECVTANTPIVVRRKGLVDVISIQDLASVARRGKSVQTTEVSGVEIWDGRGWTPVRCITATRQQKTNSEHEVLSVESRAGIVTCTSHHVLLSAEDDEVSARNVSVGSRLLLASAMPVRTEKTSVSVEMAEFLGLLTADGYISSEGTHIQFTKNDNKLRERVSLLWSRLFIGTSQQRKAPSGFKPENDVWQLCLNGCNSIAPWLREQIYNSDGTKRVPTIILNASADVQNAYLRGYYAGDGLKTQPFTSFTTNSTVLAQGLIWLYWLNGRKSSVYAERREDKTYYHVNVSGLLNTGQHLRKDPTEVRRVEVIEYSSEWVFDLETESGRYCAGVGRLVVHNSPRRGVEFVTRKISLGVARIALGKADHIELGNLEARRDWGHAADYTRSMWMMLQQPEPDDYVICTGESHSVREFLIEALKVAGLTFDQPEKYVRTNPMHYRPAEVDHLQGDCTKARTVLGWKPEYSFQDLVREMVESDLQRLKDGEFV